MNEIANILINYGFDFRFEDKNSQGRSITVEDLDIKVTEYQGEIIFTNPINTKTYNETRHAYSIIASEIEKILIEETT